MKAVVLETKDGYCAVLKDDGTIEKVKMTARIGQEITMPAKKEIRRFPLRYVAAAASFALVSLTTGLLSLTQEYSYVSVDVDASVEYSLNRMDRVVKVKGLNKKGEALAKSIRKEGIEGQSISEAMDKTKSLLQEEGYMNPTDGAILMAVSSKDEKKSTALKQEVEGAIVTDSVTTSVGEVSLAERKDAQESGLSTGRYAVVKEIVGHESLDEVAIDIAKSKTANDLILIAEENLPTTGASVSGTEQTLQNEGITNVTNDVSNDTTFDSEKGIDVCEEIHEGIEEEQDVSLVENGKTNAEVTVTSIDGKKDAKEKSSEQKEEASVKTREKKVKEEIKDDLDAGKNSQATKPQEDKVVVPDTVNEAKTEQLPDALAPLDVVGEEKESDSKLSIHISNQAEVASQEVKKTENQTETVVTENTQQSVDMSTEEKSTETSTSNTQNTPSQEQRPAVTTTKSTKNSAGEADNSLGEVVKETIKGITD